jgi:hypothetical protein
MIVLLPFWDGSFFDAKNLLNLSWIRRNGVNSEGFAS